MSSVRSVFLYVLYALIFVAVMVGVGFITTKLIVTSRKEIHIPDVTGMEVVDALETLSRSGLSVKVEGFEYSSTIPRNAILRQDPEPGGHLKSGSAIRIVLSRGTEKIRVPDVVGMTLREAEIVLARNGLTVGQISQTHSLTGDNQRILAQQPAPSSIVQRGSAVNLMVSLGERPILFMMPDLREQPQGQAILAIERIKLKIGEIKPLTRPHTPRGHVLEQSPLPGHPVREGQRVTLVVQSDRDEGLRWSRLALVRYTLPPGFLRSCVEVKLQRGDWVMPVFRQFVDPGKPVAAMIVMDHETQVIFTVDGQPVSTRQFTLQEFGHVK